MGCTLSAWIVNTWRESTASRLEALIFKFAYQCNKRKHIHCLDDWEMFYWKQIKPGNHGIKWPHTISISSISYLYFYGMSTIRQLFLLQKTPDSKGGGRKTEQGHGVHSRQVGKKTVPYQLSFKITMPCTERWLQLDERQHQQRYTCSYGWTEYLQEVYIRHKASDLLTLGPPFAPVNMESISSIYLQVDFHLLLSPLSIFPYSMRLLSGFFSSFLKKTS